MTAMWHLALPLALLPLPGTSADLAPPSLDVLRTSFVRVEPARLRGERIHLELFEDLAVDGVRDDLVRFGPDAFAWVGRAAGDRSSFIVLSVVKETLSGSLRTRAGQFRIRPAAGGLYRIEEVAVSAEPPGKAPLPVVLARGGPSARALDDGASLDLLVVYTKEARLRAGGGEAISSLVHLGVTEMNQALARSRVGTRVRLVGLEELPYREAGRIESDLEILKNETDGALDEVHGLRDAYGADFVQLVVEEHDGCGVSYALGGDEPSFREWAFSVVERGCIDWTYAMAHELGHNFGCDHAPEDPNTRGAFSYSFGYRDAAAGFRTIMAYGRERRVPHYSSPRIDFEGFPTGTPRQDNARTIQRLRTTLARFRPSQAPPRLVLVRDEGFDAITFRVSSSGPKLQEWRLSLSTAPDGRSIFESAALQEGAAVEVRGIGRSMRLLARLWYRRGSVWLFEDFRIDAPR
jgi:hypothetical protein